MVKTFTDVKRKLVGLLGAEIGQLEKYSNSWDGDEFEQKKQVMIQTINGIKIADVNEGNSKNEIRSQNEILQKIVDALKGDQVNVRKIRALFNIFKGLPINKGL